MEVSSPTSINAWAQGLLFGQSLDDKLRPPGRWVDDPGPAIPLPSSPGRPAAWAFSNAREPFPSRSELADPVARGRMLHSFANHELLAIELFALTLLRMPDGPPAWRRGLAAIIVDEQRHLRLYLDRMSALGVAPGSVPVTRFLWDSVAASPTPADFNARMGLCFEQANLDHCVHFAAVLRQEGDLESAAVLDIVLADEIGHVRHAMSWLRKGKEPGQSDWDAFVARLSPPLSPRRARGAVLHREPRRAAGLDEDFIDRVALSNESLGRVPTLWVFNPGCEEELLRPEAPPATAARILEHDLAALPWVFAAQGDLVLVPEPPRTAWLKHLAEAGFTLPELCTAPGVRPPRRLSPWGTSARLRARFPDLPSPTPDPSAFRKDTANVLLQRLAPSLAGRVCTSWEEVANAAAALESHGERPAVKPVLSAAGRGILRRVEEAAVRRLLRDQPAVLVVPWLHREVDLSLHLDMSGSQIRVRGLTIFQTDAGGRWLGSLASNALSALSPELRRFLHQLPGGLGPWCEDLAADVAGLLRPLCVEGPVGVDMLIGRLNNGERVLHPLVEVNPRWTMGRAALALRSRIAPGKVAWLRLLPGGEDLVPVELDAKGRLFAGRLWVTDPHAVSRAMCLEIGP